jgi:hypothetical protein
VRIACALAQGLVLATLLARFLTSTSLAWAQPFHFPEGRHGKGELRYVNDMPVLLVAGTPEEIGTAEAVLALKPASRFSSYPEELLRHYHVGFLLKPLIAAGTKMVERFPPDYRRELEAMVNAGGAERDRLILGNTVFDLKKSVACSALLVAGERSATGKPLLGRNLDYPSLGYAHEYSLVTVCKPEGAKHAFVSVGFPGLVGCLSGMNDAGLAVAVLEVFQVKAGCKRIDTSGVPYALCYRRILENCATIAEAKALLESMPRTTITNLAVADRESVAVFEITPRKVCVRSPVDGLCVTTNHFCSPELRPLVRLNLFHTDERFRSLCATSRGPGPIDLDAMHHCLDSAHMAGTLQAMVFEPAALRLHLAIGVKPATDGEMKPLDLSELFEEVILGRAGRPKNDFPFGFKPADASGAKAVQPR